MSEVDWIAYNAREIERDQDIFLFLLEIEVQDDLGLREVRDFISYRNFRGNCVLQTRVYHVLHIHWLFKINENGIKEHEKTQNKTRSVSQVQIQTRIRRPEVESIRVLIIGKRQNGINGVEAWDKLKIFSNEMCWYGLNSFEKCVEEEIGPLSELYSSINQHFNWYGKYNHQLGSEENKPMRDKSLNCGNSSPKIKNLLSKLNFELKKQEMKILWDQLCGIRSDSLVTELIEMEGTYEFYHVWQVPCKRVLQNDRHRLIRPGEIFSLVMFWVSVFFNLKLSNGKPCNKKTRRKEVLTSDSLDKFENQHGDEVDNCKLNEFWYVIHHDNYNFNLDAIVFLEKWHEIDNNTKILAASKKAINAFKALVKSMILQNSRFNVSSALDRRNNDLVTSVCKFRWNTVNCLEKLTNLTHPISSSIGNFDSSGGNNQRK